MSLEIVRIDPVALAECRRELATFLLDRIAGVRRIYPTDASMRACDEFSEAIAGMRGCQLEDELQLQLDFQKKRASRFAATTSRAERRSAA